MHTVYAAAQQMAGFSMPEQISLSRSACLSHRMLEALSKPLFENETCDLQIY